MQQAPRSCLCGCRKAYEDALMNAAVPQLAIRKQTKEEFTRPHWASKEDTRILERWWKYGQIDEPTPMDQVTRLAEIFRLRHENA